MLRVFKASGEEVLAVEFADFASSTGVGERPVQALDLKRRLRSLCGYSRFRQRLVLPDGQILSDETSLDGAADFQLILLPFAETFQDQVHQLCVAASSNDMPTVEQLLQRPQDANWMELTSPLHEAAMNGHLAAVGLLLEACADTDAFDIWLRTPMTCACFGGYVEIVRLLLKAQADTDKPGAASCHRPSRSPLLLAAHQGQQRHLETGLLLRNLN